jgi:hypothetical protein
MNDWNPNKEADDIYYENRKRDSRSFCKHQMHHKSSQDTLLFYWELDQCHKDLVDAELGTKNCTEGCPKPLKPVRVMRCSECKRIMVLDGNTPLFCGCGYIAMCKRGTRNYSYTANQWIEIWRDDNVR